MATFNPRNPGADLLAFCSEYHLATLTLIKANGDPHVTAVGFTYEPENACARVITWADSWKAKHVVTQGTTRAVLGTVDGGRWLALYGVATATQDAAAVEEAVRRYAARYRQPKERDDRVAIEIAVDRIVGRV